MSSKIDPTLNKNPRKPRDWNFFDSAGTYLTRGPKSPLKLLSFLGQQYT